MYIHCMFKKAKLIFYVSNIFHIGNFKLNLQHGLVQNYRVFLGALKNRCIEHDALKVLYEV